MDNVPNITHHYDEEADVLYIDFGSDEPCYTENLDDLVMIELGWFSKKMHGIRIVGPKEAGCFEKMRKGEMRNDSKRIFRKT